MPPVIEIKNLSKRYNINRRQEGYVVLREVLANVFRHPLHFVKKKINESFGNKEDFWALRDINLTVNKGEILGIIGANGTGKSTLLKILSRITPPTTGEVRIRGQIASLLEIGTGFHPELTGRENIFLNGAILGMSKKEVTRKFNDIVEFSGVEKFIDTPVKRYSSGMYVRLAFSVAAHMEPDILLVDEVLAVGDAEFQKKCLGKMDEVTKTAGRTILFVSHNMTAIEKLCSRTVLLDKGRIVMVGPTKKVVEHYLGQNLATDSVKTFPPDRHKKVQIQKISILNHAQNPSSQLDLNQPFEVAIEYELKEDLTRRNMVELIIIDIHGNPVLQIMDIDTNERFFQHRPKGHYHSRFYFPANLFNEQVYRLQVYCGSIDEETFWDRQENINFSFVNPSDFPSKFGSNRSGNFLLKIPSKIIYEPSQP